MRGSGILRFIRRNLLYMLGLILVFVTPLCVHYHFVPFQFNQFLIQRLELSYGDATGRDVFDTLVSAYSSGLNIIFQQPKLEAPRFEDKLGMFSYLFSWLPPFAVVYPTEGFYYFTTTLKDVGDISGNVRIADLDKGKLSMAYFTVTNEVTHISHLGKDDGIIVRKHHEYLYEVEFKGKVVFFKIPKTDFSPPRLLKLIPEEEFIGHVHDESGVLLFLLYNNKTFSFYYVLDEESGIRETFELVDESHLLSKRTAFVYYYDRRYDRKILVGAYLDNIRLNNFYDGPADQVPFRTQLKEKLSIAYPNTLLGGGIDDFGVHLEKDIWSRVAISPYHRYTMLKQVTEKNERCSLELDVSQFWTCLTKEWWNNEVYRRAIIKRLQEEGKTVPKQLGVL